MELENRDGIKQQHMANWIQIKAGNIHLYFVAFRRITGAADVISSVSSLPLWPLGGVLLFFSCSIGHTQPCLLPSGHNALIT